MDRPWARVPDWVGPALRPELAAATGEIIAAVRSGVPEYARPLEGRFGRRITEGVSVALNQFVDLLGVDSSPGDLRVYRADGTLVARCPNGPGCRGEAHGAQIIDITLDAPVQYQVILVDGMSDAPPDAAMDVYLSAARAANARIIPYSPIDVH